MQENILKVEKEIWKSVPQESRIGLLNGLSGIALFYSYLYQSTKNEEFGVKLLTVVEKVNSLVSEQFTSSTFCAGISGYGFLLLRLGNNFIDIDEEYFESIDSIVYEDIKERSSQNAYDYLHGSMGMMMYFIERYKVSTNDFVIKVINDFSKDLILKINNDFASVLIEPVYGNNHCYYLGLAHGVASYINFLIYLKSNFNQIDIEIKEALEKCISFLQNYRDINTASKQHYPSLILLNNNEIISPLFAWCQGDLGISSALYNTGVYLEDRGLLDEALELLNNAKKISYEESGVKDFGMCHGSIGIIMQYQLASTNLNVDFSEEIKLWYSILEKQTNNFEELLCYKNGEYFKEVNLLEGMVGLGLGLLSLNKQIDNTWLQIFNLH